MVGVYAKNVKSETRMYRELLMYIIYCNMRAGKLRCLFCGEGNTALGHFGLSHFVGSVDLLQAISYRQGHGIAVHGRYSENSQGCASP